MANYNEGFPYSQINFVGPTEWHTREEAPLIDSQWLTVDANMQ